MNTRLEFFPVSFFSVVMGLAGFAIATEKVSQLVNFPLGSRVISYVAFALFMACAFLYVTKALRYFPAVREEFVHPVRLHFFPAFSIGMLLLSIAFLSTAPKLASALWVVGTAIHLGFSLLIVSIWIRSERFQPEHLNPSWFIPIVGNMLIPISGARLFPGSYLWFFFSIGIVFWIILVSMVVNRLIFHKTMAERLIPTLFIMIAPPAVGTISYLQLTGSVDPFAYTLYFFALFLALLFLVNATLFTRIRFALSWWAYSFPLCALSIASAAIFIRT
ncbi:MAG: C4-dicarboxylate ABC transporter, partial [Candidatus Moranbacteria bacterium]|nr:C4-dicarboxylate ABC transporter [Candidatus Moranbacteria bacterium]